MLLRARALCPLTTLFSTSTRTALVFGGGGMGKEDGDDVVYRSRSAHGYVFLVGFRTPQLTAQPSRQFNGRPVCCATLVLEYMLASSGTLNVHFNS